MMPKTLSAEEQKQAEILSKKIQREHSKLVHSGATKLSPEYIALKDQYKALTEQDYTAPKPAHIPQGTMYRPRTASSDSNRTDSRNSTISPAPHSSPSPTTTNPT